MLGYATYLRNSRKISPYLAMAGVEVVVNESCGLEECVADCCAEEFETTAFHVFADCIGDER